MGQVNKTAIRCLVSRGHDSHICSDSPYAIMAVTNWNDLIELREKQKGDFHYVCCWFFCCNYVTFLKIREIFCWTFSIFYPAAFCSALLGFPFP